MNKKNERPTTNAPKLLTPTGGSPARPSNAGLMRSLSPQEYYSGGFPVNLKVAAARALLCVDLRKIAAETEERISGGKADGKPSSEFDEDELAHGVEIEREHTTSESIARDIAKDHLAEIPDYYTRLEKMERAAEKRATVGPTHPAQQGKAPQAPPQSQSPITGAPKDPNETFVDGLAQKLKPQAPPAGQSAEPAAPPAGPQPATGGVPKVAQRQHNLLFTKQGQVVVQRLPHDRFALPEGPIGQPAPYEDPVRITGQSNQVYEIKLAVGEVSEVPEGFEAISPQEFLQRTYTSLGKQANEQWHDVDRQRTRAALRWLRKQ